MRKLKSAEEFQAQIRARAKAAKAGTKRAKVLKQIDHLQRAFAEKAWLKRYYSTQFGLWRFCAFALCRRARACKGDADACLKRSIYQVPRHVISHTRQKLLEATPRHFGAVERKIRQMWPTEFWPTPINWEVVRALAEGERKREIDERWLAEIQPSPRRRRR
jgi:hypothetical protein